jgi:hypothetical protein
VARASEIRWLAALSAPVPPTLEWPDHTDDAAIGTLNLRDLLDHAAIVLPKLG